MKQNFRLKTSIVALALAMPLTVVHAANTATDAWQYSVTPYLWLPNINGTSNFQFTDGSRPKVETGPNDYLSNLDSALMISGEARKGKWGVMTDFIWLDFSEDNSSVKSVSGPGGIVQIPVNIGTQTSLSGMAWQLGGFYNVANSPSATIDVLAGFRYFDVETSVDWQLSGSLGLFPQSGRLSQKEALWDAIIGVRGKLRLGDEKKWYVPYYLDVGTGSSSRTWQALTGIGYSMGWGDVQLSYRHLEYDQSDDKLLQNFQFSGPALSAAFRF